MKINVAHTRILVALLACYLASGTCFAAAAENDEPYRPQFHFTPSKNWMNDPNGPVYYKGEYHLFFQYNPFGNEWGHMSWGHAVSKDLIHWKRLPIAIPEENGTMIFSGSTIVDWHNSSGFCRGPSTQDTSCLVAIYTGYTGKLQTQNLAYSDDDGRTWTKYADNPIIDLHLKDFRDPKVFWHEPSHKWVMVTALSDQHKVRFFGSSDLKTWTVLSDFGPEGATGGVWECPDLFELPVENEPGETRWVLSVNLNPGGIAGGSGNQYFVGDFNGSTFTADESHANANWADYGKDFYASTSFSGIPYRDGRRIWLGWLVNWQYAGKIPTSPWRGELSFPRELKLKRFGKELRLVQQPIAELKRLRQQHTHLEHQDTSTAEQVLKSRGIEGDTLEIIAEIALRGASQVGFRVRKGANEETIVGVDTEEAQLFVDRTRSGNTGFDKNFPGRHIAPILVGGNKTVKLHILVDRSSLEVFGNDGETVISDSIFPKRTSKEVELFSSGGKALIIKLDIWNLGSSWQ